MSAASGELTGRTFMVTGGNTGIGRATAAGLAKRGGRVYVACRSPEKGRQAVADIVAATGSDAVAFLPLDLADLASVRRCAEQFLALGEPLHVLINNAGVGGRRGITKDGFELAFGVNHLGHFALTTALLAHYQARAVDFDAVRRPTASVTGLPEYAVSKLCNVLFSQELARRAQGRGITTYALHPGVVASDIWRRVPWPIRPLIKLRMISPEEGAQTSLYCATSGSVAAASGRFYDNSREREPSQVATPDLARALWEHSQAWVTT